MQWTWTTEAFISLFVLAFLLSNDWRSRYWLRRLRTNGRDLLLVRTDIARHIIGILVKLCLLGVGAFALISPILHPSVTGLVVSAGFVAVITLLLARDSIDAWVTIKLLDYETTDLLSAIK
jgi:hypothetical protein